MPGWPRFQPLAGEQSMLRLLALFGVVIGLHILVSLPLSFYSGYVVEHQFGLSNQSLAPLAPQLGAQQRAGHRARRRAQRRPVLDHLAHGPRTGG